MSDGKMINKGLFSSSSGEWETPQNLYDKLDNEFKFTLDPACTSKNQKCPKGYCIDKDQDGLELPWDGRVFLNPPYGREIGKWVRKAYVSSRSSWPALVVALLPARTDTLWFHVWIYGIAKIYFIRGRLKFGGSKNSAPFPSMVVIWAPTSGNVSHET